MPLEERRRVLMSRTPNWGDDPLAIRPSRAIDVPDTEPEFLPPLLQPQEEISWPVARTTNMIRGQSSSTSKRFISSKGWTMDNLLASGKNFCPVTRVSALDPDLAVSISKNEQTGHPLVVEGWHQHPGWPNDLFSMDAFRKDSPPEIRVRNVRDGSDRLLPLSHLIDMSRSQSQFATPNEPERLYGKDAQCPPTWCEWLASNVIPSSLVPEGSNNMLLNVPKANRVETLMCYLGIGDTYTPCHKDACASSGQNLMCYTEDSGCSYWFMTANSDAEAAHEFLHKLGQELDHETYVMSVEEFADAPFKVYVVEQKQGDLVLVPPRSCHQVVNHGGITVKMSWSRMTIGGLTSALRYELPIYQRVCREETYQVKLTIYHTLISHIAELENLASSRYIDDVGRSRSEPVTSLPVSSCRDENPKEEHSCQARSRQLVEGLLTLVDLYNDILVEEYSKDYGMVHLKAAPDSTHNGDAAGHASEECDRISCDFCGSDIFQSFFECQICVPNHASAYANALRKEPQVGDGVVICPLCYVEGRSCRCALMDPRQCHPFETLLEVRRRAVHCLRRANIPGSDRMPIDERELLSGDRLSIFHIGCMLQQIRKQSMAIKGRRSKSSSQNALVESALPCTKCDSPKPFESLLNRHRIHSTEAILSCSKVDQHEAWHVRHSEVEVDSGKLESLQEEESAGRLPLRRQLASMAVKFPVCKPFKPTLVKLGWYDRLFSIKSEPVSISSLLVDSSPLTSLTSSPSSDYAPLPPEVDHISHDWKHGQSPMNADADSVSLLLASTSSMLRDSERCETSERTNTTQTELLSGVTIATTKRQHRQVFDHVLVPCIAKSLKPISAIAPSRADAVSEVRALDSNRQKAGMPSRNPGKAANQPRSSRGSRKEVPKSLPPVGESNVGPPDHRKKFPTGKKNKLTPTDAMAGTRPAKKACLGAERSTVPSGICNSSTIPTRRKVKPESSTSRRSDLPVAGSSKSRVTRFLAPREKSDEPGLERRDPGGLTRALNKAFGSQVPLEAGLATPRQSSSSIPPSVSNVSTSTPELYEARIMALEEKVDEERKLRIEERQLREEMEAQMKKSDLEMREKIDSLTASLTATREREWLQHTEINLPSPDHQIFVGAPVTSKLHLLRMLELGNWHQNPPSYPARGRGWDGGVQRLGGPSRQTLKQRGFSRMGNPNNHQGNGLAAPFPSTPSVPRRLGPQPRNSGLIGSSHPNRFRGSADRKLESNPRNDRPLSDRLSFYPNTGGDQEGRQHGTESHIRLPPSGPSHRARTGKALRNAVRPRISRHEDKLTPTDEGERRIEEVVSEEPDPLLLRPGAQQQDDACVTSPPEPEFWEDSYDKDVASQDNMSVTVAPTQRESVPDSSVTTVDEAPASFSAEMDPNPWV